MSRKKPLATRICAASLAAVLLAGTSVPMASAVSRDQQLYGANTEDSIVVYINLDAFSDAYLNAAIDAGVAPNMKRIMEEEGVYFSNAYVDLPSITTPTQARIVSGTTARYTGMYDRMYDKVTGELVKPQTRYTEAITQTTNRYDINSLSIDQFILRRDQAGLSKDTPEAYDFDTPSYVHEGAGPKAYDDLTDRFDRLIAMVESYGERGDGTVEVGLEGDADRQVLPEMPRFIAIYADDIDAYGHNYEPKYAYKEKADTEDERMERVIHAVETADDKLGELIEACKEADLYDRMSFVLTADHGMTPYGLESREEAEALDLGNEEARVTSPGRPQGGYYETLKNGKVGVPLTCDSPILRDIESLGEGFTCVYAEDSGAGGKEEYLSRVPDPDIVITSSGDAMLQLSFVDEFDPDVIDEKCDRIIEHLEEKYYMQGGTFVKGSEAVERYGVGYDYADLLISVASPYFNFAAYGKTYDDKGNLVQEYGQTMKDGQGVISDRKEGAMYARGAHDSLDERSQHITLLMWGNNIEEGKTISQTVKNTDLAGTMCALLGINAPLDSTGTVLYDALDGIEAPAADADTVPAEDFTCIGSTGYQEYQDEDAVTDFNQPGDGFTVEVPYACEQMEIRYTTAKDVKLAVYLNDEELNVNHVFFPMTQPYRTNDPDADYKSDAFDLNYDTKHINLDMKAGDVLRFEAIDGNAASLGVSEIEFIDQYRLVEDDDDDDRDHDRRPSAPRYDIDQPSKIENGSISVSDKRAEKGDTVTITVKPDEGYVLDELTVLDEDGDEIELTDKDNGKFTFKMPASDVEIEVSFKAEAAEWENPFIDVLESDYFYDAVAWAVQNGITDGVNDTLFVPNTACSRAQMVTFLWRAAGAPAVQNAVNPFADVAADAYYHDAVLWAVEQGITSGMSETAFAPDAAVTRAQTVTFLYRAAGAPSVSGGNVFADVAADAFYADAVQWAVAEEITSGMSETSFAPNEACTRGQIVTFLYRAQ